MDTSSQELAQLLGQLESGGADMEKAYAAIKTPREVLDLYIRSGPVPVTILKGLKKLIPTT